MFQRESIIVGLLTDEDAELSPEVAAIIEAFEQNPMTSGKASAADVEVARSFLKIYTIEQIEYGIWLGSARKVISLKNCERVTRPGDSTSFAAAGSGWIQSLAYFSGAIEEAAEQMASSRYPEDYKRHLRNITYRFAPKKAPVRCLG